MFQLRLRYAIIQNVLFLFALKGCGKQKADKADIVLLPK